MPLQYFAQLFLRDAAHIQTSPLHSGAWLSYASARPHLCCHCMISPFLAAASLRFPLPMLVISMVFSASAFIRYALPLHLNTTLCPALPLLRITSPRHAFADLCLVLPCRCIFFRNLTLPMHSATKLCCSIAVRCHSQQSRRDAWNSGRYRTIPSQIHS